MRITGSKESPTTACFLCHSTSVLPQFLTQVSTQSEVITNFHPNCLLGITWMDFVMMELAFYTCKWINILKCAFAHNSVHKPGPEGTRFPSAVNTEGHLPAMPASFGRAPANGLDVQVPRGPFMQHKWTPVTGYLQFPLRAGHETFMPSDSNNHSVLFKRNGRSRNLGPGSEKVRF